MATMQSRDLSITDKRCKLLRSASRLGPMKPLIDTTPLAGIDSWLGTY